ncbi:MAG: TMAO reductase system periplasmic protein TorT [Pseudomonadota bacterium]
MKTLMKGLLASAAISVAAYSSASAGDWYPAAVQVWEPAFNMDSPRKDINYTPLDKATKKWDLCVSFPHMKDAYWLGVNYGVTEEAKRLGVKMQVVEAGGYTELAKQISQIEDCVAAGAEAVIIGAISADGLNNVIKEIRAKDIPVIDVINGISSPEITAKSLVSFGEMGAKTGEYLASKHPAGSGKVKVAWFPGPSGAGWVEAGNAGFAGAIEGSDLELVETKYGDTGKETQAKLVEDTLEAHPDLTYVVGTAVTAEAAVPILRSRGITDQVKIASYYFTPGVAQGLQRGQILAAPTDSTALQGRIAIDIAVRALEGKDYQKHVGPALYVVDTENLKDFDPSSTLAPNGFKPVFQVD